MRLPRRIRCRSSAWTRASRAMTSSKPMPCRPSRRARRPRDLKSSSRRFEGAAHEAQVRPLTSVPQDAVNAVVGVFDGQPFAQTGAMAFQSLQIGGLFQTELGMGNRLNLPDDEILKNVHAIQVANDIEKIAALAGREFSIEM